MIATTTTKRVRNQHPEHQTLKMKMIFLRLDHLYLVNPAGGQLQILNPQALKLENPGDR